MELRVLKYFLAVAREENITRAAAILHITQPTLSRQLMQLEEELGVKLFRRSQYRVILTDEGMLLRRRAREIVELAEKTQREFIHREQLSGEISIGSGDLRSMDFLAEHLSSFHEAHPQIRYEIYSGNSDNIKERIERGVLDLGLLLEPVDISRYEFIRMPVKERWGVLVSQESKLASRESVTPEDLAGLPLIMTQRELMQQEVRRWFGPYGERLEIAATGNLPYNLTCLARQNLAVYLSIDLNCQYGGLHFIPLSPALESGTVLAWKRAETCSPAVTALLRHIQKCLE